MYDDDKCPRCGYELSFLAGCSAHASNRYCDNCDWAAWLAFEVIEARKEMDGWKDGEMIVFTGNYSRETEEK